MPDWKPEIRRRLAGVKPEPARAVTIIEELAQYLEDCYAEWLASGATEAEAYRRTLAELSGSELLARELRRVERQVAPEPVVPGANRHLRRVDLQRLGAHARDRHSGGARRATGERRQAGAQRGNEPGRNWRGAWPAGF